MPHHFLPDEIIQQKKRASPSKPRPDWAPDLDDFNKDGPRQLAKWRKSHSRPSLEPAGLEKNEQAHILIRQVFGNQKKVARFRAMITGFSDSFGSSWNEEAVFARMDPIPTFQRTSRKIALSFKVVSASKSEGRFNIAQIGRLVNFLYPVWMQPPGGAPPVPQAAPVVEIKFANLISGASKGSNWLSGFIGSLNITHEVEVGFLWDDDGNMIPKEISIGFDFTVLHGEVLGSDPDGKFLENEFPYGINSNTQKTGVNGTEKKDKNNDETTQDLIDGLSSTIDVDRAFDLARGKVADGVFLGTADAKAAPASVAAQAVLVERQKAANVVVLTPGSPNNSDRQNSSTAAREYAILHGAPYPGDRED